MTERIPTTNEPPEEVWIVVCPADCTVHAYQTQQSAEDAASHHCKFSEHPVSRVSWDTKHELERLLNGLMPPPRGVAWFQLHETAQDYMKGVLWGPVIDSVPPLPGVWVHIRFLNGEKQEFFYLYDGIPEYALDRLDYDLRNGGVDLYVERRTVRVYRRSVASIELLD